MQNKKEKKRVFIYILPICISRKFNIAGLRDQQLRDTQKLLLHFCISRRNCSELKVYES